MENINLNLGGITNITGPSINGGASISNLENDRKIKIAKDFEGVLINKVMDEMQDSVPDSGLLEDETSKQTQGLFWMYLSQDVAAKGGFGLWKQIYSQMNETAQVSPPNTMDAKI